MHDVFIVSVRKSSFSGILLNRADAKELRAEIKDLRTETKELRSDVMDRLERIDADLRQFYHLTVKAVRPHEQF